MNKEYAHHSFCHCQLLVFAQEVVYLTFVITMIFTLTTICKQEMGIETNF